MIDVKTNYHTHCYLCRHAVGKVEDYVKKAISLGYTELGMSDHGPVDHDLIDIGPTRRMTIEEFHSVYLPEIDECIKKYGNKIKIYKSGEFEYFRPMLPDYERLQTECDYLVLGQHDFEKDGKFVSTYAFVPTEENIKAYAESVIEGLNTGYFKILAHPELYLYVYLKWDKITEKYSRMIIEAAIKNNVYLELNTNGWSNCLRRSKYVVCESSKYHKLDNYESIAYPNCYFWELVKEYPEAKIIINQDAHDPEHLGDADLKKTIGFAEAIGLNIQNKIEL